MPHSNQDTNLHNFLTPLLPTKLLGYVEKVIQRSEYYHQPLGAKEIVDEIVLLLGSPKQIECQQFFEKFLAKIAKHRAMGETSFSIIPINIVSDIRIAELFIEHCLEQASITHQSIENHESLTTEERRNDSDQMENDHG